MAIGTPEGCKPLSSLKMSLIDADGAATPLGSCFSRMQARGGAFTLHPWLMASKPPACWSGEAHCFGAAEPAANCTSVSCTLYRVFRETSVFAVFCDFGLVRRVKGVYGGYRAIHCFSYSLFAWIRTDKVGSACFQAAKKSSYDFRLLAGSPEKAAERAEPRCANGYNSDSGAWPR